MMKKSTFFVDTKNNPADKVIWIAVLFLALYSLFVVFSSTISLAYKYSDGETTGYLFKQFAFLALGYGMMYVVSRIKIKYYRFMGVLGYLIAVILLLITMFYGVSLNNAGRWLEIPLLGLRFQPSEIAKFTVILFMALSIERLKKSGDIKRLKPVALLVMLPLVLVCGLIFRMHLSTTLIIGVVGVVVMIVGGVKAKHIFYFIASVIALVALAYLLNKAIPGFLPRMDTWEARVVAFINSDSATVVPNASDDAQSKSAKMAIANGIYGVGPGLSTQRYSLPHSYSDFAFAIAVEEYGLLFGVIPILFLYSFLLYRGLRICHKSKSDFESISVFSILFLITLQALIHFSVSSGIIPVTGQTLPLISMGGSSIVITGIALGFVQGVSRNVGKEEEHDLEQNEEIEA